MEKAAEKEKARERHISNDLRQRLNDANRKIEKLRTELENAKSIIYKREVSSRTREIAENGAQG